MIKKLIALLLCVITAAAVCGCKSSQREISFFLYDATDTFISEMTDKMLSALPANLTASVFDGQNSQSVQNKQILECISDGSALLLVNAVDRLACGTIAEKCEASSIPVIFFNREPQEGSMTGALQYYVGCAAENLGELQAQMAAELFGSDYSASGWDRNGDGIVQIVIIKGEQGHQDAEKRTEYCIKQLKELGYKSEVLAIEVADWQRSDAYGLMAESYPKWGEDVELIFSNNDDMALGAIDYLTENGIFTEGTGEYSQPFVIIGVDGTAVGLDAIGRGLLYGTVLNNSDAQSDAVIRLVECLLGGSELSEYPYEISNRRYIYIDGAIILRDNMADYVK